MDCGRCSSTSVEGYQVICSSSEAEFFAVTIPGLKMVGMAEQSKPYSFCNAADVSVWKSWKSQYNFLGRMWEKELNYRK